MIHGIAWIARALFYAAFLALIIFYILQLPIEAQGVIFTRPTPVVEPMPTLGTPFTPTPTSLPLPAIKPTLSVSCVPGILAWECTAIVDFNGSNILHALAVDDKHLIDWQQIRMPDAWGVELRYSAPAPCSGELSRIRLLANVGEETIELDRHTVTARCNLLPFIMGGKND